MLLGPCLVGAFIGPVIVPASKDETAEVDDDFVTCNRVMAYEKGSDCSAANVTKK